MATRQTTLQITRWQGGQHPTPATITHLMKKEGLRPYVWDTKANHRYAIRSHNYDRILYVIEGSLEITLPDQNQFVRLQVGDRIDIPAGVRHGVNAGNAGLKCIEAAIKRQY